ncbi:hypothetical protein QAA20_004145 [Salmonella enterica]|nr:hypothetical protein [Salmonella enterica]EAB6033197.1 hypothetical protein [Salmonella enterica subsp. enterica serovar Java]EBI0041262.1 hypothetical protein [Salmonella enterica subsp. diarizonae serovar 61:k:z35]ECD9254256.1 hypothetical protein [Salmonella enterica subsp. diarizonae]ECT8549881.1 hypothetical protein [Salmonella enterica subsp. diarizonae serovar 48:i:z]EIC4422400.1 hypothetical protein [Salmonella enterica subsp. enterica serovar Cerro]
MATTDAFSMAAPAMVRICLYGDLERFGRRTDLSIKTAAEGIRALAVQIPGFRQRLSEGWHPRTITSKEIDRLRITFGTPYLQESNDKGDRNETSLNLLIQVQRNGSCLKRGCR